MTIRQETHNYHNTIHETCIQILHPTVNRCRLCLPYSRIKPTQTRLHKQWTRYTLISLQTLSYFSITEDTHVFWKYTLPRLFSDIKLVKTTTEKKNIWQFPGLHSFERKTLSCGTNSKEFRNGCFLFHYSIFCKIYWILYI